MTGLFIGQIPRIDSCIGLDNMHGNLKLEVTTAYRRRTYQVCIFQHTSVRQYATCPALHGVDNIQWLENSKDCLVDNDQEKQTEILVYAQS